MFWTQEVRRSRDVLEAKCSRSIDVVRSRMNLSNKLWEPFEGEVIGATSVKSPWKVITEIGGI